LESERLISYDIGQPGITLVEVTDSLENWYPRRDPTRDRC